MAPKSSDASSAHVPRRSTVWRFLIVFGVLLAAYYALILLPAGDRALYEYLRINARASNAILQVLGQDTRVDEVTIRNASFAVTVRRGCDAVEPTWFFCAAVLAFPAPWRRKWLPLALGASTILSLNLVRIVSLFLIGRWSPQFFATAHFELWPTAFILIAVLLWTVWIRSVSGGKQTASHASP